IINQHAENVICVYVAVGQKDSTVKKLVENLQAHGAMDYTFVVLAASSDPAPLQYVAPYAGCAMAEFYMYEQGRDTLCVYDDLSKQAAGYRQLSLLMRRPPGREAYPGDIFYAHSRLLERSAKLAERWVIVPKDADEKKVGDDWGVNRGPDGKGVVYIGPLDKEHAEKHDLPKHAGHKLDKATQSQLDRGYRMVEILKQAQFKPMHVADQVAIIYAGSKGYLDKVPRKDVAGWEEKFLRFMREQKSEVRNALVKEKKLTKEIEAGLKAAIEAFVPQFKA